MFHLFKGRRIARSDVLLVVWIAFFQAVTAGWLLLDRLPPTWDDSFYLAKSLIMLDALADGGLAGYFKNFIAVLGFKPPLISVLPTPIYLCLGRDYHYAFAVNFFMAPLLFFSIYRVGEKHWNARTGLVAAYILGTMPMIFGLARWYMVEFTLSAWVCFAMWLLIDSCGFEDRRRVVALGVLCGLGSLLKVSFLVYVALPTLYVAIRFVARKLKEKDFDRPAVLGNLFAFFLPAALIPLPWYLPNLTKAYKGVILAAFSPVADYYGTGSPLSVASSPLSSTSLDK